MSKKTVTKAPRYRGPKKNHAAVWIGTRDDGDWDRIRIIHSKKVLTTKGASLYEYKMNEDSVLDGWIEKVCPCWAVHSESVKKNVKRMQAYSKASGMKNVFLGYVRDAE